jgi:hypothetical protein
MKLATVLAITSLSATAAIAQEPIEMFSSATCIQAEIGHEYKTEEMGEQVLFLGRANVPWVTEDTRGFTQGLVQMYVNQDTGTWTVSVLFGDGIQCDMLYGFNFQPY